jgi:predicted  nucleic acid-binding Zn-ribbon protein
MEKRLNNKFVMYKVVRDWLRANVSQFEGIPGFVTTIDEFSALLSIVAELDESKNSNTTGISQTKAEAREELETVSVEVIRMLKVYAAFSNNHVLLNEIDFTESQLKRSSEQVLLVRSNKVMKQGQAVQLDAEPYGLTTEKLNQLETSIQNFDTKQTVVRNAIVNKKNAGEQLEAHMDEADDLLKDKLDLLMDLVGNTKPILHQQYKGVRVIVDR